MEYADPPEVTVLLPCLNEAQTVGVCVRKALDSLRRIGVRGEVVVSDNGSTDGSQELAVAAGARVVQAPIRGYGGALLAGIDAARGRYVVMGDADDSYDLGNLGPFVAELTAGRDVVMGNRFRGGIAPGAMPWLHRFVGNPVLSWLGRILFGLRGVGDFHWPARVQPGTDPGAGAVHAGHGVRQRAGDPGGAGRVLDLGGADHAAAGRPWPPLAPAHLAGRLATPAVPVLFAPRQLLIAPGIALILLGVVGAAWLLPGERRVDGVGFDVSALVYACLAILVGAQLLMFGGFAQLYGLQEGLIKQVAHAWWSRVFRLETCVAAGLALMGVGVAGTIVAIQMWSHTDFGPLDPRREIRIVVPSATAVALGVSVIFAGLFASLLSLRTTRPGRSAVPAQRQPPPDAPLSEKSPSLSQSSPSLSQSSPSLSQCSPSLSQRSP